MISFLSLQIKGIDKDFRKLGMYNIVRKSYIDSTGRPALAEFNCNIKKEDGTSDNCYANIYRASGSNVATRSSCRRFFPPMGAKTGNAKSENALSLETMSNKLTKLHWYSRSIVGLAVAILVIVVCGWAKTGAIFKAVVADKGSRKSIANPVVMMTSKQHKPIMP